MSNQLNKPPANKRIGFLAWFEWIVMGSVVLVAAAAIFSTFFSNDGDRGTVISQFANRADALARESNPIRRDSMCIPLSAFCRSIDAQLPTNSKVFLMNMLGTTNQGNLGYYYFLNNYLYPREVAVSIGMPPKFVREEIEGQEPTNMEELAQAGYDLVLKQGPNGGIQPQLLKPLPLRAPEDQPSISNTDTYISFFLPLALALAGTRLIRWLFRDSISVLTTGELFACGLAAGMFLLTQLILLLRIMGARLEWYLGMVVFAWALLEIVLWIRNRKKTFHVEFRSQYFWWLLLIPAAIIFWYLFRLASLEGLAEFDAIAHWEFKGKLLYYTSGKEIWAWASNPAYQYAILNNPLGVSLLYTFQWGVLGHVNEFVIKLWNQWMLLALVFAILGAGQFCNKRSWFTAATVVIMVSLPITLMFTRWEGSTIPFFFYVVLGSMQLALGLAENEPSRLRLGLFILMGSAMVKIDGGFLFGVWGLLLLLNKEVRTIFWPIKRIGIAGLIGVLAWVPFFYFRAHALGHYNDQAPQRFVQNLPMASKAAPMVWLELISRRLFNNDFASWISPDDHHVIWNGKWSGLGSLADTQTLGLGWVCLLALFYFLINGRRCRRAALSLFTVSVLYSIVVCITFVGWALGQETAARNFYTIALNDSDTASGGRYLYPVFMACFVGAAILLSRRKTEHPLAVKKPEKKHSAVRS